MDICPCCKELKKLSKTIFDGSRICLSCYLSPYYKVCHDCAEVFPIHMVTIERRTSFTKTRCTGCAGKEKHDATV